MSRRIFFCAVMQDEAVTAARCLDSASKIAATIVIADGDPITPEPTPTMLAVEEWKKTHPRHTVHVIRREWRDFGYNKTMLLHDVRKLITKPNCYIAFCDADEVFVTNPEDPTSYLTRADVERLLAELDANSQFNVFQMQTHLHRPPWGLFKYPRWQILRNDQPYRWFMPHQEYLQGLKYHRTYLINWIYNYSRSDGNSARHPERREWARNVMNKYIDDISKEYDAPVEDEFAFLYDELKEDVEDILSEEDLVLDISTTPTCSSTEIVEKKVYHHPERNNLSRSVFYQADNYTGFDNAKALELLQKRAELGGDWQENYVTYIRIAKLTTGEAHRDALIKATYVDSSRLEAYYYLMKDCIDANDNRRALGWAMAAPARNDPPSYANSAEASIYSWEFDYWASIPPCDAGQAINGNELARPFVYQFGLEMIRKVLKRNNLPPAYAERARINESEYLKFIPAATPSPAAPSCSSSRLEPLSRVAPLYSMLIVDNFYPNPDEIRQIALTMEYPVKGNYPGFRTKPYLVPGIKEKIEAMVGRKIIYWPTGDTSYNGSFQYVTKQQGWSSIHRDSTDYSLIIFLTKGAPIDSGTNVYQHETGISKSNGDKAIEDRLNQDFQNDEAWDITASCGNLYNRAVAFDGRLSHKAGAYFGDNLQNARLFQTFFFDVEK